MNSMTKECRICFESDVSGNNPLIVPCKCDGTSRYIHRTCLDKWRETNVSTDAFYKCRECNDIYTIEFIFPQEIFLYSTRTIRFISGTTGCFSIYIYLLLSTMFYRSFDFLMNNYTLDLIFTSKREKKDFLELTKNL